MPIAQQIGERPRQEDPSSAVLALTSALNLTDAQKIQLRAIEARYRPQFDDWGRRMRSASEEERQARGGLRREFGFLLLGMLAEIDEILTPVQRQQLEQWLSERSAQQPGRSTGRRHQ